MKKLFATVILFVSGLTLLAQNGDCPFLYGANERDSIKCREQITNLNLNLKGKNYKEAYEAWQYVVNHCPCSWSGIYSYAQTMFDNLIRNEQDSAQKERYVDSLLYAYQVRNRHFPNKFSQGSGLGFMAYNTMKYRPQNFEQAYQWYIQSVEMEKEKTQPVIWDTYFKLSEGITKAKKDTSIVIEAYERATDYIDISITNAYKRYEKDIPLLANLDSAYQNKQIDRMEYDKRLKTLTSDTARQMKLITNYQRTIAKIEKDVTPYASCSVLEEIYTKKLAANPTDIPAANKMVITLSNAGCTTIPVFKEALEIAHKANPNRNSAYWMGNLSLKKYIDTKEEVELTDAINYFLEAIELSETNEKKVEAYYMLAVAYQTQGSYSEARAAAYDALKIHPNLGKVYILIGDLYANSATRCSGDDLPQACAWAAADKYNRAAAVDPSCAAAANAQRAKLRFPGKEECFTRGLHTGDYYHVGCWIQENTTVR